MMDDIIGKKAYKKYGYMAGLVGTIENNIIIDKFPYVLRYFVNGKDMGTAAILSIDDIVIVE